MLSFYIYERARGIVGPMRWVRTHVCRVRLDPSFTGARRVAGAAREIVVSDGGRSRRIGAISERYMIMKVERRQGKAYLTYITTLTSALQCRPCLACLSFAWLPYEVLNELAKRLFFLITLSFPFARCLAALQFLSCCSQLWQLPFCAA